MLPKKSLHCALLTLTLTSLSLAQDPAVKPTTAPAPPAPATPKPVTKKPVTLKITMRDGLRFDPLRAAAKPGDEVVVELENADSTHQTHNFVLLKPGKLQEVIQLSMAMGEKGLAENFVPASPEIIVHSAILNPDQEAKLRFKLPNTPGIYPYVCTFPGHGMVMYGALYVGVPMPALKNDPNIPATALQAMIAGNGKRPFVQRMFMPQAGPAAIAVALAGDQNFCWDAGQCRLRYAWKGAFIDASDNWRGNGKDLAQLPTAPWWSAPADAFPVRFGSAQAPAPKMTFLGYHLAAGIPEFHYRANEVEIFEKIEAGKAANSLVVHYRILKAPEPVFLTAGQSGKETWTSSSGQFSNHVLTLSPSEAADFSLTLTGAN